MGELTINGLELVNKFDPNQIDDDTIKKKFFSGKQFIKFSGNQIELPLIPPALSQNILFTGGIGSGKTNAICELLDQLLDKMGKNDVMIIFDSKGDFAERFPTQLYPKLNMKFLSNDGISTVFWNVFKEAVIDLSPSATRQEINDALLEMSSILFQPMIDKDKNNPFFTLAAKNIFYGISKVLCEKYYIQTRNPNAVTNRMIFEYSQKPVEEIVKDFTSPACYSELNQLVDYLGRLDSNLGFKFNDQGASVLATLRNTLLEIFKGNFVKDGSFSVREFISSPGSKVLFIEYDIRQGQVLAPIYKAILDFAIKEALSRHRVKRNVFFVIDEFRLLPKLDYMDAGVNFGRVLGAKFIIGIQNILQIDDVYGKPMARSILSGFLTSVNFRTVDSETREYIKSLFGKRIYVYDNLNITGGQTRERDDVVTDNDILKLKTGQAIIGIPVLTKNPILFQFLKYDDYLKQKK